MPLAVAAALCLLGVKANASLPNGYESVTFKATLTLQNSTNKTMKVSMSNKDLLALIAEEFTSATIPSGAQLVMHGLADETFNAVLDKNNNIVIANASSDGDYYELFLDPFEDTGSITANEEGNSPTFDFSAPEATFTYRNGNNDFVFILTGIMTAKDNEENDNESYSMQNATGYFKLDAGGEEFGTITGSLSGSGKEVDVPFFSRFAH